jgi:hypothetical protein
MRIGCKMDKLTPIEIAELSEKFTDNDPEFALYLSAFGAVRKADEELNMNGMLVKDILKDVIVCGQAAIATYEKFAK